MPEENGLAATGGSNAKNHDEITVKSIRNWSRYNGQWPCGLVLIKLEHDPMSTLTVSLAQFRQENMYGSLPDS